MPENGGNDGLHGDAQAQAPQHDDEAAMLRLLGGEDEAAAAGQWEAPPPNLDQFFTRIYRCGGWGCGGGGGASLQLQCLIR